MSDPIRECAILLFAADMLLADDHSTAERALEWSRSFATGVDTDPIWADGRHEGDCTKTPMTCARCLIEQYEAAARLLGDDWIPDLIVADQA